MLLGGTPPLLQVCIIIGMQWLGMVDPSHRTPPPLGYPPPLHDECIKWHEGE